MHVKKIFDVLREMAIYDFRTPTRNILGGVIGVRVKRPEKVITIEIL
jgi:hypothetical protein